MLAQNLLIQFAQLALLFRFNCPQHWHLGLLYILRLIYSSIENLLLNIAC